MLLKIYPSLWYVFPCFYALTDGKALFSAGKSIQKCGTLANRGGRIVGGEETFEGEFPWIASLKSSVGHFCAAFVISDRHLISAAHCFAQHHNHFLDYSESGELILKSLEVTLGEFSLQSAEKVPTVPVPIDKLIMHPDYHPLTKENDIAIIQLNQSGISVHPGIIPICLPDVEFRSNLDRKVTTGVSIGWGRNRHDQPYWDWVIYSDVLKKVNVQLWSPRACAQEYTLYNIPSKAFICAGEIGRDSCKGDSGGPLQVLSESDKSKWTAIGVVSAGRKCGSEGKPGIYTDISAHLDWIYDNVFGKF